MYLRIQLIVDQAIRFERNLASLYFQFHEAFPEDAELWWGLSVSEEGHASLLSNSEKLFHGEYARELVDADLAGLRRSNQKLESIVRRFGEEPLPREEAFRAAVAFEDDQNERTFFDLLKTELSGPALEIVDSIRYDDSMHAQKIRDYAARQGISIAPE